jgi:hypothetical protein
MDPKQLLEDDILPKEEILWSAQPTPKLFTGADFFLVPFSVLWGGFAIFWEDNVLSQGAPVLFSLWGIPFVLIGLYFIFGRFIYKNYKKKHTYYLVTNQRVIVLTNTRTKKVNAAFIRQVPAINKSGRQGGVGTIRFGNANVMDAYYGNTGLDFFAGMYGAAAPTFYDVPDADHVYQLVNQVRQKAAV